MACGREDCVTCCQDDPVKMDCFKRSIVYESSCELCHPGGTKEKDGGKMIRSGKGCYTGESSRSMYERTREHADDARRMERDSHQVKHWFLEHPGEADPPKFRFRVIGSFKDAMSRQVKEAIRIQNRPGSLNSKGEFGGGVITRLVVEKSDFEQKKQEIGRRRKQEDEDLLWENFLMKKQELDGKRRTTEDAGAPTSKRAKYMDDEEGDRGSAQAGDDSSPQDDIETGLQADEYLPDGWNIMFMLDVLEEEWNNSCSAPALPSQTTSSMEAGFPIVGPPESTTDSNRKNVLRKNVTGVNVMGSKKIGGAPIMLVRDIAQHFRSIQKTEKPGTKGVPKSTESKNKNKSSIKKKYFSFGVKPANLDSDYSGSAGPTQEQITED